MTAMRNLLARTILGACFLGLAARAPAQVSFQYDLAGNRVAQSNGVVAAPPVFQDLPPEYIGAQSNGLLSVSVPVTGDGPFAYQWLLNGVAISGATNAAFIVTNAATINLGKYQLVAANSGGAVTSIVLNVSFFDPDGSGLPVAWELAYFDATGVDPNADPDGDGVSNFQEYLDGTDPTNPHSVMPRLHIPDYLASGTVSVVPLKPKYQLGDIVRITAQPDPGGFFDGWFGSNAAPELGTFLSSNANLTLAMNSTKWLTPQFTGSVVAWGYNSSGQTNVPAGLSNVVAIAAGGYFSMALGSDGTVRAWGDSGSGETTLPAGLSDVVAIAGGGYFGLALQSNGKVAAWGDDGFGESTVPAGLSNVAAISGGLYHALALQSNGTVVAWGNNSDGQTNVPAGLSNVVAIAAGDYFSLALQANGTVVAWGENDFGQADVPAGLSNVAGIAAGAGFALALQSAGTVAAWGYNGSGQTNVPVGLSNVVAIAAGNYFSLALQDDGTVVPWGSSYLGETAVPAGLSNVVGIVAGTYHSMALLNDGSPFFTRRPFSANADSGTTVQLSVGVAGAPPLSYQWTLNGTNLVGATNAQLTLTHAQATSSGVYNVAVSNPLGTASSGNVTLSVDNSAPLVLDQPLGQTVRLGESAAFAVNATGSLPLGYQWQLNGASIAGATGATLDVTNVTLANVGNYRVQITNAFGTVFSSNAPLAQTPTSVAAWGENYYGQTNVPERMGDVVEIAAEGTSSLALESDGTVVSWGDNEYGETNVPGNVSNVVAIAGGAHFSLAVLSNGTVAAWGDNSYGQTNVPAGLSNVMAVAGGTYFSLALLGNGTVVGWGNNDYGQTNAPAGLSNVIAIAAGEDFALALQENGTLVGWGENNFGQTTPPAGLSNVVAISAGTYHSLALLANGAVVAWGYNGYGQSSVPAGLSNVVAIAGGGYFSLALQENGTLTGWGDNSFKQSTAPAGVSNVVAIAAGNYHTLAILNGGSPFFSRQPLRTSVYTGATAVLSVAVVSPSPVSYQWTLDGSDLVGATNASLTLTNLQTSRSGAYSVVVSNSLGTASSAGTTLTVSSSAPIILDQPSSQTLPFGGNAAFAVAATGSLPLSYQWQFNGTSIPGATKTTLDLADVTAGNVGNYRVEVSNALGTVFSSNAALVRAISLAAAWGYNSDGQTNVPADLGNVLAVAAESYSSLALRTDGTVAAWGDNTYGETDLPAGLSNVVAIAGRTYYGLALESNGMVVGWGNDNYRQTNVPTGLSNVVAIAAGSYHALALRGDGTVAAWGYDEDRQTNVPAGLSNVAAIAAGGVFSMALQDNGQVVAWGDNSYGETNVPPGLSNVVAIAAGFYFDLALQDNGTVVAWGYSGYGETAVPTGLTNVVAIAAGDFFGLALQDNGMVVGWGDDTYGETTMPAGLSNVVAMAGGSYHTVAVFNNGSPVFTRPPISVSSLSGTTVSLSVGVTGASPLSYQWKLNGANVIGATNALLTLTNVQAAGAGQYSVVVSNSLGTASNLTDTLKVSNSAPIIQVQPAGQKALVGANAAFAAAATGSLPLSYQWQFNGSKIAGATQAKLNLTNVTIGEIGNYRVEVSNAFGTVFSSNAALTRVASLVVGWGDNSDGQTNIPAGLGEVVAIAAESYSCLALQSNGMVAAWGDDNYGETNVPVGLSNVVAIAGGGFFSLALRSDGTVVGWGDNSFGQRTMPAGLSNVVAIAAGVYDSMALESNGTVLAWGYDGNEQTNVPVSLSNVVAIAAGAYHCLALLGNGTVVAWGDNAYGETNVPAGLSNVVAIAAGSYHSLALQSNGTLVGWGDDTYGETTSPAGLSNVVGIAGGNYFSLANQGYSTVVAWGNNSYGQTTVPASQNSVVSIAAGGYHGLALLHDGSPFITRQPVSETADSGTTIVLSVAVLSAQPVSYQWKLNGVNLVGATNALLTLTNAQTTRSGTYSVVVGNSLGAVSSVETTLTVNNAAPIILVQPANQSVLLGGNAAFSVTANGSPPLSYQWQFNGKNITGATQSTLDLADVTEANVGNYRVEVSNAFGVTISSNAALPAALSLVVAWGDNSNGQTTVPPGLGTVVAIAGDGYSSLALQSDGAVVAWGDDSYGETNVLKDLVSVVAIAGGLYHNLALDNKALVAAWGDDYDGQANVPVGLTNVAAIAAGFHHSLALGSNGTVAAWGDDYNGQTTVPLGLSNVGAIAAGGNFSLALQDNGTVAAWGDDSAGQSTVPTGLSNMVAIAAGNYFSLALGANGTVAAWGDNSHGQTNVPPDLSNVVAIAAGGYFGLALQDSGTVVAWGDDHDGQTNVPPGLSNAVAIAAGEHHAIAVFNNGSPFIARQPIAGNAYSGATALLSVGAAGAQPLSYQWQLNRANLVGATNALLTLTNVPTNRSGGYSVVVSNSLGTASSADVTLTVIDSAPIIPVQPANQAAPSGGNATFTLNAIGSLPLSYQWQFNGAKIAGATQPMLNVTNVTAANVGNYRVEVSNAFGTTFSSNAALNLRPANDLFANRIKITGSSNTVAGSNAFATEEPGEPEHADNPGGSSVWWTWTAPTNGIVTVGTAGSSFDTLLAIYTGSSVSDLTLVASDDDNSTLLRSSVTFVGAAGADYQIAVDGFDGATGAVVLIVWQSPPGPPAIAIPLQSQNVDLGGCVTFSVTAAGLGPFGYEWLKNGALISGAAQSTFTIDNLQTGDAATYSVIVTNGYGGVTNSASLTLFVGPPNDAFVNAIKLTGPPQIVTGTNVGATKEPGEPEHGANQGGSSVWWSWTAPKNESVTLDTTGSSFETLLGVYTGDAVSNLTLVANDNGLGGYRTYFGSHVAFSAVAGTAYEIAVDGYDGASGSIELSFQLPSIILSNNIVIGSGEFLRNGQFQMSVENAVTGQDYTLLASTDLVHWAAAFAFVATNSPMVIDDPLAARFKQRFYRIEAMSTDSGVMLPSAAQRPVRGSVAKPAFMGPPLNDRIEAPSNFVGWLTRTNVYITNSPHQQLPATFPAK
jgi:alpha-tubulin suppressor-like RCC1 family protein